MKALKINRQDGFTLIETLMAMAIFTIGILGLFGMQTAVISKNLSANNITSGSTWAADQAEQLISLSYNHDLMQDSDEDGCDGLNDSPLLPPPRNVSDGSGSSGTTEPVYNIYWNVAKDCTLKDIPPGGKDESDEQRPKYLRIIVTKVNSNGTQTEAAVYNYIKQNSRKK